MKYKIAFAAATLLLTAATLSQFNLFQVTRRIELQKVTHLSRYAYGYPAPRSVAPFILVAPPEANALKVDEDGSQVRCHSLVKEVDDFGRGRCIFIGEDIFFSTRSSDDPRSNGKTYSIEFAVRAHVLLMFALVMLVAFFGLVVMKKLRGGQVVMLSGVFTMGVGASLCVVNVAGLFVPLRSPDLRTLPGNYGPNDVTLTPAEAFDLLKWRATDDKTTYSTRATMAVADSVLHGWPTVHMERYRVAIPPTENWILYLLGAIRPELRPYIFWSPRKEIERGLGICGDVSSALVGILRKHGIDARVVGLTGHVVVTAQVEDKQWYILDPDVGVVIPESLAEIEENVNEAKKLYEAAFLRTGLAAREVKWEVDLIMGFYSSVADNSIDASGRLGYYSSLASPPEWYGEREKLTYKLKWPLPFLFLGLGCLLVVISRATGMLLSRDNTIVLHRMALRR